MDDVGSKVIVAVIFASIVAAAFVAVWWLDRKRAEDVAEEPERQDVAPDQH